MLVYVAHPYTKNPRLNKIKAEILIKNLATKNPTKTYISPIHNFSVLEGIACENRILQHCKNVIDICDGVIFAPGWEDSKGCRVEMEYCIDINKSYSILSDDEFKNIFRGTVDIIQKSTRGTIKIRG